MSVIFIFVDGIGLASTGADNPLSQMVLPALHTLLGGPLALEHVQQRDRVLLKAIDATMEVAGLPQSGTGQTALLAGVNAAALNGRHQSHFPPTALRPMLAERSMFRRVVQGGGRVAFANVFGSGYWEALAARRIRRSASVIAAEGAGLRFRDEQDLDAGQALSWDITGEAMIANGAKLQPADPAVAGMRLVHLADTHELVFFETFLPDLAGHGRLPIDTATVLERIDALIGGALAALQPSDTLVLTSDHGNIESISAPAHTRNPVPLLVVGADTTAFAGITSITQVADVIVEVAVSSAVQREGQQ